MKDVVLQGRYQESQRQPWRQGSLSRTQDLKEYEISQACVEQDLYKTAQSALWSAPRSAPTDAQRSASTSAKTGTSINAMNMAPHLMPRLQPERSIWSIPYLPGPLYCTVQCLHKGDNLRYCMHKESRPA